MKNSLMISFCIFIFLSIIWETNSGSVTRIISTQSGLIQGNTVNLNEYKVDQYLGIPFAQPPVGELRFRKPYSVKPWTKLRTADKMGPACIQYSSVTYPWYDDSYKSEDCLYLNIWVPRSGSTNNSNENIPVFFFIYGGGFTVGSNKIPLYNGSVLASEGNIVVVTINYRLSSLGFFTTGTETAPGNVAMYDILEALTWVNRNINAFGGDSDQVTIAGESAGSLVTGMFCLSPLTKGLFRRVIMESGSPAYLRIDDFSVNIAKSQIIAEKVGCADVITTIYNKPDEVADCMRGKNPFEIIEPVRYFDSAIRQAIFPNFGDEILPVKPPAALMNGLFQNVDVLIGNVHDEGSPKLIGTNITFFGPYGKKNPKINKRQAVTLIKKIFKDIYFKDHIIQHYLGDVANEDYDKIREQVYTAIGDFSILCPTTYFAEIYSKFGNNVYYYYFVHRSQFSPWAKWMKVPHFEDVPYVFGNPLLHPDKYSQKEVILSLRIIKIFSNFVKYGSPDFSGQSNERKWPLYSRENPVYVALGTDRKGNGEGPHSRNCDFFRPYFGFT